ncbi:MAG: HAMP domain-containing sensor histidine kinase [Xanthomonadales bacterium]|nr:HAMP domain-containing sensor histidine kinase [Xanthomonadales bacterium]
MTDLQFLYALLITAGLGSSLFSVTLYLAWKRRRGFLLFSVYAFLVAIFLSVNLQMQLRATIPLWMLALQMILAGCILASFYEANRIILAAPRARVDYIAAAGFVCMSLTLVVFITFVPELLEVISIRDRLGQVIILPRFTGRETGEWQNLVPALGIVTGWLLWTARHVQFICQARHRVETRFVLPVVIFSVIAPVHDFGVVVQWWNGIFFSFFTFGVTAFTASVWLLYQLYRHSQRLEDLTHNLEQLVEERTRELKTVNVHLQEANALKNDFLAICSHDLKNLLSSVHGYGELLRVGVVSGAPPETLREYANEVRNSTQRMLDLTRDLLDSARLDSGCALLEMQLSSVAEVVTRACAQHANEAKLKGVDLRLILDDDLPSLSLDQSKMQQAVANLLHNAVKFTPAGGEIRCEVTRQGDGSRIRIADTGPGIGKDDQRIVFDKFAVARKRRQDRSSTLGTGLGLSITKTFVEMHGGRVKLVSEPGAGAIFEIFLPGLTRTLYQPDLTLVRTY